MQCVCMHATARLAFIHDLPVPCRAVPCHTVPHGCLFRASTIWFGTAWHTFTPQL